MNPATNAATTTTTTTAAPSNIAAPASTRLPPNWTEYKTDEGKAYYHNSQTGVTQWQAPDA